MSKDWKEKFRPEDLQRLRDFRLMDDDFMSKCFEENMEKVAVQHQLKNLQGRSIIFDIYATDRTGKRYNVEIQRADRGAGAKRARYHSSLIDANATEPGEKLENLIETYVIFITERDVLGKGKPIYHIERVIKETSENFGDEAHILYVNGEYRDESPIGILMHDFSCTDAKDMKYRALAERVRYFKEDEKGVAAMCKTMEDMRNEAALEKGKRTALNMLALGKLSYEEIAQCTELSLDEVKALAEEKEA